MRLVNQPPLEGLLNTVRPYTTNSHPTLLTDRKGLAPQTLPGPSRFRDGAIASMVYDPLGSTDGIRTRGPLVNSQAL